MTATTTAPTHQVIGGTFVGQRVVIVDPATVADQYPLERYGPEFVRVRLVELYGENVLVMDGDLVELAPRHARAAHAAPVQTRIGTRLHQLVEVTAELEAKDARIAELEAALGRANERATTAQDAAEAYRLEVVELKDMLHRIAVVLDPALA